MAYFEYTPQRIATSQPESLRLVAGSPEDEEAERLRLQELIKDSVLRRESEAQDTQRLDKSPSDQLPIDLVSRLMDPEYYESQVMHAETGLAMYAPRYAEHYFDLLGEDIGEAEHLLQMGEDGVDPDTYEHLGRRDDITHDAIQYEPILEDGRATLRGHKSFGYINQAGHYEPVVTEHSPDHPGRPEIYERSAA
jgi:hypothetical protein